jgi:ribosomal protein L30/L7E
MVQLIHSRNGTNSGQEDTLDSLGLRKIGHARVIGGDMGSLLGALHKVRDWVGLYPLTSDAVACVRQISAFTLEADIVCNPAQYQVGGHPAVLFDLGREHFARCELYDDCFAFGWSSGLPIATALTELVDWLPSDDGIAIAVDSNKQRRHELPAAAMITDLRRRERSYSLVRFEWPGMTLVWTRSSYPRHRDEYLLPGSVGLITSNYDQEQLKAMIHRTATEPVDRHAKDILKEVAHLAAEFNKGQS